MRHQHVFGHERDISILAGIRHRFVHEHLIEGYCAFAFAGNFVIRDCFVPQKIQCNLIQIVGSFRRVQQVGGDHGVKYDAVQLNPVAGQNDPIVFYVLTHLFDGRILQYRLERV